MLLEVLPPYVHRAIREGELAPTREQIAISLSGCRKQSDRKLPWKIACSERMSGE